MADQNGFEFMGSVNARPTLYSLGTDPFGYDLVLMGPGEGYSHYGLTGGPVCLRVLPKTTKWPNLEK